MTLPRATLRAAALFCSAQRCSAEHTRLRRSASTLGPPWQSLALQTKGTRIASRTTFEPQAVDEQIGYLFKVVQTALREAMDAGLEELEVSTPVYAALTVIDRFPDISKADLARHCFVRPQSMTRIVASMIEAGLISRSAHPGHGRILQTRLTPEGAKRLARAHAAVAGVTSQMLVGVGPADRAQFHDMLVTCRDRLAEMKMAPD
jgi:DNA-binding MarR family transcriptional regulator